jgi:hypothetical protein
VSGAVDTGPLGADPDELEAQAKSKEAQANEAIDRII